MVTVVVSAAAVVIDRVPEAGAARGCAGATTGAAVGDGATDGCVDDPATLELELESLASSPRGVATGLAGGNSS